MKNVILTVDVGNSQTVMGLFAGGRLRERHRSETPSQRSPFDWEALFRSIGAAPGAGSIVSSVVPHVDRRISNALRRLTGEKPLFVDRHMDTGIRIRLPRPETLGADRLVNAAYAFHRYGGPLIIVDFGTATTLCAVTGKGEYVGGAILPGILLSLNALSAKAAKLPHVSLEGRWTPISRTTESAMRLGAVEGHRGAVERIGRRMKGTLGPDTRVIATGGLARLVARGLPFVERIEPDLTVRALHYLYRRHVPPSSP